MKCSNCGAENPDRQKFCGACGKEIIKKQDVIEQLQSPSQIQHFMQSHQFLQSEVINIHNTLRTIERTILILLFGGILGFLLIWFGILTLQ